MTAKPAILREELPRLQQRGFQRVRLNGEIRRLDEPSIIDSKASKISVETVVDRVVLKPDQRSISPTRLISLLARGRPRNYFN